jgi:hypothetical protein
MVRDEADTVLPIAGAHERGQHNPPQLKHNPIKTVQDISDIKTYNGAGIRWWSPTQLLTGRRVASTRSKGGWVQPPRDAAFSRATLGELG